jgi:hypothetical protein
MKNLLRQRSIKALLLLLGLCITSLAESDLLLTKGAQRLIERAAAKATQHSHAQLSALHLADALFDAEQENKGGIGTRVGV